MRRWLAVFVLASAAACTPAPAGQAGSAETKGAPSLPPALVDPYLKIHEALADDRLDGVHAAAGEIVTAATALGAPGMKVDTAALALAAASEAAESDVKDVRVKFGALSEAIVTYMKGEKLKAPEGVRTAYCPMADKPWLQKGDTLSNPYYGKEMPTCGEFR